MQNIGHDQDLGRSERFPETKHIIHRNIEHIEKLLIISRNFLQIGRINEAHKILSNVAEKLNNETKSDDDKQRFYVDSASQKTAFLLCDAYILMNSLKRAYEIAITCPGVIRHHPIVALFQAEILLAQGDNLRQIDRIVEKGIQSSFRHENKSVMSALLGEFHKVSQTVRSMRADIFNNMLKLDVNSPVIIDSCKNSDAISVLIKNDVVYKENAKSVPNKRSCNKKMKNKSPKTPPSPTCVTDILFEEDHTDQEDKSVETAESCESLCSETTDTSTSNAVDSLDDDVDFSEEGDDPCGVDVGFLEAHLQEAVQTTKFDLHAALVKANAYMMSKRPFHGFLEWRKKQKSDLWAEWDSEDE